MYLFYRYKKDIGANGIISSQTNMKGDSEDLGKPVGQFTVNVALYRLYSGATDYSLLSPFYSISTWSLRNLNNFILNIPGRVVRLLEVAAVEQVLYLFCRFRHVVVNNIYAGNFVHVDLGAAWLALVGK